VLVASIGGIGYSPVAPGTAGSLVALLALWFIPFTVASLAATIVVVSALGIWSGGRAEQALGRKDPGVIVIDEVAGMLLSAWLLPRTLAALGAAFLLFRLFDIWKPFPADQSQSMPGGLGVMMDDLIAGLYALALVFGAHVALGVPVRAG